ncbi:hypothetical protein K461DRAFT_289938 [Myriangium duriaei CBS 260.36]|uniref:Uncharacterized protein n=1 Tax=Myriangium duriaei CBS 260.36 TaxID=1168546 RepID=A0A9P4JEP5_9PEZI|nr:hypothetical protein K461DRAFT_289938 [Myriangium duriaei CBS 260.36]
MDIALEYRAHRKEVKAAPSQNSPREDYNPIASSLARESQSRSPCYPEASNAPVTADTRHSDEMLSHDGDIHPGNDRDSGGKGAKHDHAFDDDDEAFWQLDEATHTAEDAEEAADTSPEYLVADVLRLASTGTATEFSWKPLSYPVIIPQRRPRNKSRGFVHAYAPDLDSCGIDQATFLQFLKNFQKSSQANPIFPIIKLSAGIAGFAPSLIAMGVCMGVQVLASVGAEAQSRQRTNTFLDQMNNELFRPHGLYAMIIKYRPDPENNDLMQAETMDMSTNSIISKYMPSGKSSRLKTFRSSSGITKGAAALPQAAPLIFPDVDHAVALDGGKETLKSRARDAKYFLNEYMDRRAQIKYTASDPHSALNLPEGQLVMRSKNSNMDQHNSSNGLRGLLGGRMLLLDDRGGRNTDRSLGSLRGDGLGGGRGATVKKLLQEDVFYLLIVNMPSEAELAEARRNLESN